jgi:hypothetical protein
VIARDIPSGIVGVHGRDPIGVHLSAALRGANGAPAGKGVWWFTTQATHKQSFKSGSGSTWTSKARDLDPAFRAWNEGAKEALQAKAKDPRAGLGRFARVRGNFVHERWQQAARWNRRAQKLAEGHPNPRNGEPACEGNGVWAWRFAGEGPDGRNAFDRIACPNEDCQFAMSKLCRPAGHLLFQLRWDPEDPLERGLLPLMALWDTTSWESTANLKGLLEHVLGTEALLTDEERAMATNEERAEWRTGLAAQFGVPDPSLVGLPFVMTINEKTSPAKPGSPQGSRYTVVRFSPDGDLVAWLLAQARRRRELAGGFEPRALPAAVTDPEFLDVTRHDSILELTGAPLDDEPAESGGAPGVPAAHAESGALLSPDTPVLIGPARAAEIEARALRAGLALETLRSEAARIAGTGSIRDVPASEEPALLAFVAAAESARNRSRRA